MFLFRSSVLGMNDVNQLYVLTSCLYDLDRNLGKCRKWRRIWWRTNSRCKSGMIILLKYLVLIHVIYIIWLNLSIGACFGSENPELISGTIYLRSNIINLWIYHHHQYINLTKQNSNIRYFSQFMTPYNINSNSFAKMNKL